jgi:FG-GAP repeat protein
MTALSRLSLLAPALATSLACTLCWTDVTQASPLTLASQDPAAVALLNEQKVVASDGASNDWFGSSVLVAGPTAFIGAPSANVGGHALQGAVYVFNRINGVWTQGQKLVASDGAAGDQLGWGTAISGNTLMITAQFATVSDNQWAGAVYVFQFANGTWTQTQKLTASDETAFTVFGRSVAIADGYALIGAGNAQNLTSTELGSVYSFKFSSGAWGQTQKIPAYDQVDTAAHFGDSVAMSDTTALIGAYNSTVNGHGTQGAVYSYTLVGGSWIFEHKILSADGNTSDAFGRSIAFQNNTALIGAPGAAIGGNASQGAVYYFGHSGSSWLSFQKLIVSDGATSDSFGVSVSLSATSSLIGAYGVDSHRGSAYLFSLINGTAWNQQNELVGSDSQAGDQYGLKTSLDSCTALVGAFEAPIAGHSGQGAAYFYTRGCRGTGTGSGALVE